MKLHVVTFLVLLLSACSADPGTQTDGSYVEIYAVDQLDNIQNGYCIDIAKGKGASADPANGLQAHTCYSPLGEVLVDQAFDPEKFSEGVLYMPIFDVCVQAPALDPGTSPELAACDGSDSQRWNFDGEGSIRPATAGDVCITITGETRTGRSKENQMKVLTLEECTDDRVAFQTWANRTVE